MQIELPYNFYPEQRPFQAKIWNDKRKNKLLVIPRRHGKTSLAINWLILQAICNSNKVYWYLAPTYVQAKGIVWKAPDMINKYLPLEAVDKKNDAELTIYFKNGSQICVKGADNPDSLRGMNPHGIVIDEYAQVRPEIYDEILMPILLANSGWAWLIGTPKGKNHFYNKLIEKSNAADWQVMHLKASTSGVLSKETLEEAKRSMTEKAYSQEFETEFLEDAGSVFRRINDNSTAQPEEPQRGVEYVLGVDLAKYNDFTVISVINKSNHKQVHIERFNQIDWTLQKARIEALARRYNDALVRIDGTGVGDPIVEDLINVGLSVESIKFNNQNKSELITNLAILLEQDKIKLLDNEEQKNELQAFSYEMTDKSRRLIYGAPVGQHDDCVIALALSVFNLGEKQAPINPNGLDFIVEYDDYGRPYVAN